MGWSLGEACDRAVGYGVEALCDEPSCNVVIDRGLGRACNDQHGRDTDEECNGYFCAEHEFKHECERHYEAPPLASEIARLQEPLPASTG